LFSKGDDGPRRSNPIREDDDLKQRNISRWCSHKKYKSTNGRTSRL